MSQFSSPNPPNERDPDRDRLIELLADQALEGLSLEESAELERLRAVDRTLDPIEFERGAAAAHVAFLENAAQSMPAEVRKRLTAQAAAQAGAARKRRGWRGARLTGPMTQQDVRRRNRGRAVTWLGWLAAAACLALAVWGWWPWMTNSLLLPWRVDRAPDRIAIALGPGNHESGKSAAGNVYWSNTLNKGYLRVRGLQVNNPAQSQYQLWVKAPNQEHPIDAGVFDVTDAAGEITIPINAKLRVAAKPELFAITVEQPGGVVVSDLQRVSVAASPAN